ncbi:MAG: flagellar capping protein [Firmicutes bacterium]|nr:flagellar capping protein [Bacillota bacterium]
MATRISNLGASGMDIDEAVKSLMKARRAKYDQMGQKKTLLEWKKADYNTMYNTISEFRDTVFTNKLQATLAPKTAASSNETVATVTANADAVTINHDLVVTALADGVKKISSDAITAEGNSKDTLANQFGISGAFNISIKNGDTTKTITVDSSKSIYELVSNINKAGVNVTASYDTTLDRFFLSTNSTGAQSGIDFTGSDAAGLSFLADNLKINTAADTGQDAAFQLDGIALTQSTNSFTISGVNYSLKAVGGSSANPVKISASADIDKTVENVKNFITSYNAMLAAVNGELSEDRYSDYAPLTDDQKSEMKESDITAWTAKSKSGLLRHDSILQNLIDGVRSNISTPVSGITGSYATASSIGITTGSYSENGKLYLDETKLRTALAADSDAVNKIFGASGMTSSQQGISVRLYNTLKTGMDKIVDQAGITASISGDTKSNLAKQVRTYTTDMSNLNERMQDIEDRYYAQFTAMDTALQKLSSQSSWLAQQFGTSS